MPDFDDALLRQATEAGASAGAIQYRSGEQDDPSALLKVAPWEAFNRKPERNETIVPSYDKTPLPEVYQFLWLMFRSAGTTPPWRVRVSPALCAKYGMRKIAIALSPHAQILMTPDGRHPAPMYTLAPSPLPDDPTRMVPRWQIEYCYQDQAGGGQAAPAVDDRKLWMPDDLGRTKRTTT